MIASTVIYRYFADLSDEQKQQFELLYKLYSDWNSKINIISRKDIENLYLHHVLHSLGIAKIIGFKSGSDILDLGTGGGFPGIPLAILFPKANFHLVDSIGKKIRVVRHVADFLSLTNVVAEQKRAEDIELKYDFVVGRAVTKVPILCSWVRNKIKTKSIHNLKNGLIYLKGEEATEQMQAMKMNHNIYSLADYFIEDYFQTKKVVHLPM